MKNQIGVIDIQSAVHKTIAAGLLVRGDGHKSVKRWSLRIYRKSLMFLRYPVISRRAQSTKEHAVIFCPVRQDDFIDHFAASAAFPCIKRPYEIIRPLGIHPALAFWTIHGFPLSEILNMQLNVWGNYSKRANTLSGSMCGCCDLAINV